jgi:hypothetical protein
MVALTSETRERLGGGVAGSILREAVEALDSWSVLASEDVEALAVRLSSKRLNLRFVVASAGSEESTVMLAGICELCGVSGLWVGTGEELRSGGAVSFVH